VTPEPNESPAAVSSTLAGLAAMAAAATVAVRANSRRDSPAAAGKLASPAPATTGGRADGLLRLSRFTVLLLRGLVAACLPPGRHEELA